MQRTFGIALAAALIAASAASVQAGEKKTFMLMEFSVKAENSTNIGSSTGGTSGRK